MTDVIATPLQRSTFQAPAAPSAPQRQRPKFQKAQSVSDHLLVGTSAAPAPQQLKATSTRPKFQKGKSEHGAHFEERIASAAGVNQALASSSSTIVSTRLQQSLQQRRCSQCGRVKTADEVSALTSGHSVGTIASKKSSLKRSANNNNYNNNGSTAAITCILPEDGASAEERGAGASASALSPGGAAAPPPDLKKVITLWQNYYPEGHWGWIIVMSAFLVQCIAHGSQLSYSVLALHVKERFRGADSVAAGLLGPFSLCVSLLISPISVSLCKRRSTRLVGIFGGLVAALAYLFTSFASQFHQLFVSYGVLLGIGVGFSRDAASLMVGGYFKKKRDFVEIIVVAASGVGVIFMAAATHGGIRQLGWRHGLQAITLCVLFLFFLGIFYRSPSLYHPQRRAILHLKNQRRKVKEKYKKEDSPPFFDFTCLRSMTLRILFASTAISSFGLYVPLFFMHVKCQELQLDHGSCATLHFFVGGAWVIGCLVFGFLVVQHKDGCSISKQYLCQGSGTLCGLSIFMFVFARDSNSLIMFSVVHGFSLGAYNYALKVYTLDRARARHFPRAWSYLQCCQSMSIFLGAVICAWLIDSHQNIAALFAVTFSIFAGVGTLFFANVRRRTLASQGKPTESFKINNKNLLHSRSSALAFVLGRDDADLDRCNRDCGETQGSFDSSMLSKNLVSISEEGLAEIDFQEIYFEDFEEIFGADAITSCNKVENCIASEADPEQLAQSISWDHPATNKRQTSQLRRNSSGACDKIQSRASYSNFKPHRHFHTHSASPGTAKTSSSTVEASMEAVNPLGVSQVKYVPSVTVAKHKGVLKHSRNVLSAGGRPVHVPSSSVVTSAAPITQKTRYRVEMNNLSVIPSYESLQKNAKHSGDRH